MSINYAEKIPNNVDLSADRQLQRALERWQPAFLNWWGEMGPDGDFQARDVYLRTATSVDAKGWATYGHVKMPDYRWGIFLADKTEDRTIGFGDSFGQPVWQQVPGEFRSDLRRLIVTQGDTEPASVEQQRMLAYTCPSLYDMRNLFQVNVEEGRHLWAMVYLLHAHFGRDGREEAEDLLERHSGDVNNPRILTTFNEPIDDWMSFFSFTYFTDRDGKFQLKMLAESAFDPLSRTCRFMLTEEAHHMFVGETGLGRVIRRALEVMQELNTDDPQRIRDHGAIDLGLVQKYINYWYSSSLDLFGADRSTNAAAYFANGLKGRPDEDRFEDHLEADTLYRIEEPTEDGAGVREIEIPTRNAMNLVARKGYSNDCDIGITRWNRMIRKAGVDLQFSLPSDRFRRTVGPFAGFHFAPDGTPVSKEAYESRINDWIPSEADRTHIKSLMKQVTAPGRMAGWIAPPDRGINNNPVDYEYVRL
ncbi:MAG: benzoyl-CoA 2,3-epoxidase subunit BoxB [Rhodospirillaceae bacterium]|nr:benzoyl-CoA 2,3-epoxidase subunit BoxB [Rhodospirillaceae bacterium]MDE0619192.1 benzoyl-CoA 2,3-epoxidase subunit BoxB [Rhodospirillaceae bacterium]